MPPKTKKKICERCDKAKPATAHYFPYGDGTDGLEKICRECGYEIAVERRRRRSEKSKEWARANKEKVRESYRRTYEKNRDERLAYMRRWREQNKERVNEYQREYAKRRNAKEVTKNESHIV